MERRTFLVTAASVAGAGCIGGGGGEGDSYGDWFDGVDNFDGEVDRTGQDETRVMVGVDDGLAYGPPAIIITPGTTVVWEWTGNGGGHNVVSDDGIFESELTKEAGHTFEQTFDDSGLFRYFCTPHSDLGMRGGVRVRAGGGDGG
ncbi:halocyanin domain-containing protein [Haloglomus halophilum]|uniref:halocyanin domain-containing protein n=1 Tax=Haloglomus halophilum TaxID=2962672 RepID=UPI0020C9CA38|nr:halocyanin domain-containing protein [Haloglomus halophilum]